MITRAATPPPSLMKVQTHLTEELYRTNRSAQHRLNASTLPLDYLVEKPFGVEVLAQLSSSYRSIRPIDMRLFTPPAAVDLDWKDDGKTLGTKPSLVMMFENVPVKYNGREVMVDGVIREEFQAILERNPGMKAELKIAEAEDFPGGAIKHEYRGYKVAWVEGELANFKVKRIMMLTMSTAYSLLTDDARYAMKIPEPPPTRH